MFRLTIFILLILYERKNLTGFGNLLGSEGITHNNKLAVISPPSAMRLA
ncbi:MAG: hypothetical protein WCH34_04025 [Bacteroidota bacterium]